jgi:transcription elongation factor GreA
MFRHNDPAWSAHPDTGAADELPVTTETHEALECEVAKLMSEKERDIPERLRAARENGDGSSNDEFFAIREEEMVIDARLARLQNILGRARVIDPGESGSTIAIGSAVLVKDLESGKEIDYVIGSAHAASSPGTVSAVSPVGAALLGRRRDDRVTVVLPKGRELKLQVLAIKPVPPR